MTIKSLDVMSFDMPMKRKKWGDFGEYKGTTSEMMLLLESNKHILTSLLEYEEALAKRSIPCNIFIGVEETDLLYVNTVMFIIIYKGNKLQVSINLKDTCNFKYLYNCVENGIKLKKSLVDCYTNCWRSILYTVLDSGDFDYVGLMIGGKHRG